MKLTVQTLKNAKHSIEVKDNSSVLELKQEIHTQLQLGEPEEQKLIHVGKILKDDQTLTNAGVKSGDAIVIMISKKKTTAAPATQTSTTTTTATSSTPTTQPTTTTPSTTATTTTQPTTTATSTTTATQPSTASSTTATAAASNLVMGDAQNETIANLMGLGFERDQVVAALRAAFNNPDRAADYLFNGIPASAQAAADQAQAANRTQQNTQQQQQQQQAPASPTAANAEAPAAGLANLGLGEGELANLRGLLQSNPAMLQQLLTQLAQQNPELVQRLQQNPQELTALLGELGLGGGSGGGGGGGGRRDQVQIQISPEEKTQLDNLVALGFSQDAALEAFLACDRNYELAATYLLDHGGDVPMGMFINDELGGDEHDEQGGGEEDDDYMPDQDFAE